MRKLLHVFTHNRTVRISDDSRQSAEIPTVSGQFNCRTADASSRLATVANDDGGTYGR